MTEADIRRIFVEVAPKEWNAQTFVSPACKFRLAGEDHYVSELQDWGSRGRREIAGRALHQWLGSASALWYDRGEWTVTRVTGSVRTDQEFDHAEPVYAVMLAVIAKLQQDAVGGGGEK